MAMTDILKVIGDAMMHDPDNRPCEIYRKLVCPLCTYPKGCNDLDVIMCAVAKLLEMEMERR